MERNEQASGNEAKSAQAEGKDFEVLFELDDLELSQVGGGASNVFLKL
jgi:hypothetical protein